MTVVRIARHRAHANDQAFLVGRRDRRLHAEFVGYAGLALRQTFNFRCVQRVELVFVLWLLRQDPLRAINQLLQFRCGLSLPPGRPAAPHRASPAQHANAAFAALFSCVCTASRGRSGQSEAPDAAPRGCSSAAASGHAARPLSPDVRDTARAIANRLDGQSPSP